MTDMTATTVRDVEVTATSLSNKRKKMKHIYKRYILIDLCVWLTLIVLIPAVLFGLIYFFTRSDQTETTPTVSQHVEKYMHKVSLEEYKDLAVCNDGSVADYYLRLSESSSTTWIIVLDGGYFCYDSLSCQQRAVNSLHLTSSTLNQIFKPGKGILSNSRELNKHFYDANIVNVPYCSSDLWIGNKRSYDNFTSDDDSESNEMSFMGSRIIDSVLDDLISRQTLGQARLVVLVGQSAGGIGLMLNADRIKQRLEHTVPRAELKCIIDSAWILDYPYSFLCRPNDNDCIISKYLKNAIKFWNASLPSQCASDLWNCFLPQNLLPLIKVPTFIVQNKFDETQMIDQYNQIKRDDGNRFVHALKRINEKMTKSIHAATKHYFMPSCFSHIILTRSDWSIFKVKGHTLESTLSCWLFQDPEKCNLKMMEECKWPNCTGTCPELKHPDTGQSIGPIEYFNYFGLVDYDTIGSLLNISSRAVRRMNEMNIFKLLIS